MELVCDQCIAFFVDNGLVAARCPELLQSSLNTLITLLERIGLRTNSDKTKVMTCLPGKIQVARMEAEYASQQTGLGPSRAKRQHIDCKVYGASLAAEPIRSHLETQHDIFWLFVFNGTLSLQAHQWSTVLPSRPTLAYIFARWHSVADNWAPGLIYASIFSCNIPRIRGSVGQVMSLLF